VFVLIATEYRHRFSANSTEWGFGSFASHNVICNPGNGFMCDDALTLEYYQAFVPNL
jgi:hypothetical protein